MRRTSQARGSFTVTNELGLHTRAAAIVVRTATRFKSRIRISNGDATADAASVLDLLTLAAARGAELIVEAEGPDAQKAVDNIGELIDRHFAE